MRTLLFAAVCLPLVGVASQATAAPNYIGVAGTNSDSCSDVLVDGPFSREALRKNDYYLQVLYSRFSQMDWSSYQKATSAGGSAWFDAIPYSANLTQDQFEQRKRQIEDTRLSIVDQRNELDYLAFSGDEVVVGAWRQCMLNRGGGLKLRFEATPSPTQAFLILEFVSAPGTSTKLGESISLPADVTVTQGKNCLKKGKVIRAGPVDACVATLQLPSYDTAFAVSVNTANGAAKAFLPKRAKLIYQQIPFDFEPNCDIQLDWFTNRRDADLARCEDRLPRSEFRTGWPDRIHTLVLPKKLADEGWRFVPATAKSRMIELHGYSMTHCWNDLPVVADLNRFQYGYKVHAEVRGHSSNVTAVCKTEPSIDISKMAWVSADAN
jgi:hypothetical protein